MLDGAFPTPEDHDASYSTATSCSSISATSVSLLAWKRSLCLFPRVSPRVAARQNSGPYLRITTKASCMPVAFTRVAGGAKGSTSCASPISAAGHCSSR